MHADAKKKLATGGASKNVEWVLKNVIGCICGGRSGIRIGGTCGACGGDAILCYVNK